MEKVSYQGWSNCYRLANRTVELIVTADVGPRVIRFGFLGKENEFQEYAEQAGKTGGDEWRIYGGHRLWHSPEAKPRTYWPDNGPVAVEQAAGWARFIQPVEPTTGMQKEMDILLATEAADVRIVHRIRNQSLWPVEFAPWALSVMNTGGMAIVPLPPRGAHTEFLAPTNILTMWAYTDFSDPRWMLCPKYICLRQVPGAATPQKTGIMVKDGWAAYVRGGHLFVKSFGYVHGAAYPDMGASVEIFTDGNMLEVESLGPVVNLAPGGFVEHTEHWRLMDGLPAIATQADIDAHVLPRIMSK
jgi:hypothetical protein